MNHKGSHVADDRNPAELACLLRPDAGWIRAIQDAEFCISHSPDNFGEPAVKARFARTKKPQTIDCPATKRRYILLRSKTECSEHSHVTVTERGVMGE